MGLYPLQAQADDPVHDEAHVRDIRTETAFNDDLSVATLHTVVEAGGRVDVVLYDEDGVKVGEGDRIEVRNPEHVSKGVREIFVDGRKSDRIPVMEPGSDTEVVIIMGGGDAAGGKA